MADFILLDEDFSDFPIGEFPYDKNHSAMGEYHFIHYPGYYGKWYDPVCNHTYNGQGASWIISEYNGKHFMEQMRIRNDKPHRTFPMLTSGDRFWRDYTITASVRMFTTKWGNAGIGFCCQNSANLLVLVFEDLSIVIRRRLLYSILYLLITTVMILMYLRLRLKAAMLYAVLMIRFILTLTLNMQGRVARLPLLQLSLHSLVL